MPSNRNYSGGSIVYFEKDRGEEIYVLQSGKVILTSTAMDSGEEVRQDVQKGEFFGVKSSLGTYPREETAQVMGNTSLLVFKKAEFETLVLKNTRLIMKMLRVFSKQLRDVHRQVREIMRSGAAREPAYELMNVAESFFRSGSTEHAVYAFGRYLEYYPGGSYTPRCNELLQMARKGLTYPLGYPPLEPGKSELESDMNDVVRSGMQPVDQALDDPFAMNSPDGGAGGSQEKGINSFYADGMNAFGKGDFEAALMSYQKVLEFSKFHNQEEADVFSKAHFEKGRTLVQMGNSNKASSVFTEYLKKFPTGEHVKESIFQLGMIAETGGQGDRARNLYHKVATMPPPDAVTNEARKRLEGMG